MGLQCKLNSQKEGLTDPNVPQDFIMSQV